jgi:2-keto-4-pentenoate hydratase
MNGLHHDYRLAAACSATALEITSLTLEEAYKVQDRYLAAWVSAGQNTVGWKIGCTSRAIQQQFGLAQPICGRLMKPHIYEWWKKILHCR